MPQFKLTMKRGAGLTAKDVTVAAGSAEAQSDTMSLNIDQTKLTKGEAIIMLEAFSQQIQRAPWPQV
jgi:lipopolysaccharide export system protein LptA